MAPFPEIKSKHSLVAKHVTEAKWAKLGDIVTKTSGFTLAKAIACAVEFDNQHCGIYAGDEDSYIDFADVFDPLICEYHGLPADFSHVSDMDSSKITGNVEADVPVHSCRYVIKTTSSITTGRLAIKPARSSVPTIPLKLLQLAKRGNNLDWDTCWLFDQHAIMLNMIKTITFVLCL